MFTELLDALAEDGDIVFEGPRLRAASFTIQLSSAQKLAMEDLVSTVLAMGLEGPRFDAHVKEIPELLQLLLDDGRLVRVGPHLIHNSPLVTLKKQVSILLAERGEMQPTDFKEMTGLSRRFAIPLLEWLDAQRVTVRRGDVRVAPTR